MLLTTDRCSIPTEASSAAGLQMAGNPTLVTSSPRRTSDPARHRQAGAVEHALTTILSESQSAVVQLRAAGEGHAEQLEHRDDHRLETRLAVDPFAEIEDEIEFPLSHALDPASIVGHGNADDLGRPFEQRALDCLD